MRISFRVALALAALALWLPASASALSIKVGQKMPNFTVYDIEGNKVNFSDFKGKVVMMAFWASWCPRCMDELVFLQKNYSDSEDLVVLAINQETRMLAPQHVEKLKGDIKQMALTFPVLLDKDFDAYKQLSIAALPTSIVVDRDGKVIYAATTYYADTAKSLNETLASLGVKTKNP
ncbi:TlpA family protein disulfide reductase [bacterium]|nr:MAG: TlpA family protein disulfide reductase [bacterium]